MCNVLSSQFNPLHFSHFSLHGTHGLKNPNAELLLLPHTVLFYIFVTVVKLGHMVDLFFAFENSPTFQLHSNYPQRVAPLIKDTSFWCTWRLLQIVTIDQNEDNTLQVVQPPTDTLTTTTTVPSTQRTLGRNGETDCESWMSRRSAVG